MKEIEIRKLQGKGNGFFVLNAKSKREREFLIEKLLHASISYRKFYKIRNAVK